ncbi:family 78 glycoside hydrolase catalytic domain [Micromonospora sp. SL4-19]|uniref:family 78 glycoside hydrolase catalytic domain n=1 Tax=Micromonospora sp. SL4-19 TaxID=3399129 RepID=UPI003A4DA44C
MAKSIVPLAVVTLAASMSIPPLRADAAIKTAEAGRLETNADPTPLGIDDATPEFSWVIKSDERAVRQKQYRVVVASTAAKAAAGVGDVWDSGEVESDAMVLEYNGPGLKSRTRYYWSVRAWVPGVTKWAPAAWFETAYLDPSEWRGSWIAGPQRPVASPTTQEGTADDACCLPNSTLTVAAPAGATNIKVSSIAGATTGDQVTVGLGDSTQTVTMTSIGTASTSTTLAAPAPAGDSRLYLASVNGLAVNDQVVVDGSTVTVTEVGTAAQASRTLSAPAAAGDTNIKVNNTGGFAVGQKMIIGSDANASIRTVTAVGTAGATGTGITFDAALTSGYPNNTPARGLGSGVGTATALNRAVALGGTLVKPGTGIDINPALIADRPVGTAVRKPGDADICRPVGNSPNAGQCKPIRPTFLLRQSFDVAPASQHGKVVKARLYSTGLGWGEASLNGEKADPNGHLNPGFTDYKDTVQYTTDDVTELIKQDATAPKKNVLAAELGAGRYDSESVPSNHRFENAQWRNLETLRADLYVTYADGTEQLVKSDDSWKTSINGPTRYNDFDNGETYDARKQIQGWNTATVNDSDWADARVVNGPQGQVVAMQQERTEMVKSHPGPFRSWKPSPGVYAFDTERQRTGWATIKVWGAEKGQVIRIVYVERRNDDTTKDDPDVPGTGQDGALQLAGNLQQEYYVSDGTGTKEHPEVYAPNWNFAGFQWVQIDGSNGTALPDNVKVDVDSVQEIRTNLPEIGTFESSVPLLNQIYANVRGSVAGDWVAGYSMDTPTYEKDGWTGDAQIILPTVANIFDIQRSMRKSARDAVDSQLANGQVGLLIPGSEGYGYCSPSSPSTPNVYVPCGSSPSLAVFKSSGGGATPIWDAFLQVVPAEGYLRYDDLEPIKTAYNAMTKYMDVNIQGGKPYDEGPGGWFVWDGSNDWTLNSGLGDWAFVTGAEGNAAEGTNLNVGGFQAASSTAFTAYLATKTAEAARLLYKDSGDSKYLDDAKKYEKLFENIKAAFNARWWHASRGFYAETPTQEFRQGFQAWAIGFGLVPDQYKRSLQEKLAYDVAVTRTGHAMVGFVGIRWIWPVLSDAAHEGVPYAKEALFKVAQQTTYPSYGYHVGLGYTGVGEYWESSTRTRNHQFQGSIGQWFYEELAGIKPAEAGYRTISIRPMPGHEYGVDRVSASVDTVRGLIKSEWIDDNTTLTMRVTIPANTTARVHVPAASTGAVKETGSGRPLVAANTPGVRLVGPQDDAIVYEVGSGTYTFVVTK